MLSLVLAPLATEMPEKANSVLWVRRGKDALALGNITGAMTFQATIPVVLGLVFTDWELDAARRRRRGHRPARRRARPVGDPAPPPVGLVPVALWGGMFVGFVVYASRPASAGRCDSR